MANNLGNDYYQKLWLVTHTKQAMLSCGVLVDKGQLLLRCPIK